VSFKNVQILYQNSIVVSATHVYVKASAAIHRQRAQVPLELNKRILISLVTLGRFGCYTWALYCAW